MKRIFMVSIIAVMLLAFSANVSATEKSIAELQTQKQGLLKDVDKLREETRKEVNKIYKDLEVPIDAKLTEEQWAKISKEPYVYREAIFDYLPKQVSLTAAQETQIGNIIKTIVSKSKDRKIIVEIIGYADEATGNFADNEKLRQDRSQVVASVLRSWLPESSKIEARPSLRDQRSRGVVISWHYLANTKDVPTDWRTITAIVVTIALGIGVIVLLSIVYGWTILKFQTKPQKQLNKMYWLLDARTIDGNNISIRIHEDGKNFVAPFIIDGKTRERSEWSSMKKKARLFTKNRTFQEILNSSEVTGDIFPVSVEELVNNNPELKKHVRKEKA